MVLHFNFHLWDFDRVYPLQIMFMQALCLYPERSTGRRDYEALLEGRPNLAQEMLELRWLKN